VGIFRDILADFAEQIGVEAAAEAAVGGDDQDEFSGALGFAQQGRGIVGHAFSAHETVSVLTLVMKDAFLAFGLPKRFYVDNGSAFSSDLLARACARAGISLTHSKPYDSPSRGKIERFFSQPFFVAETFTNIPGKYVSLKDTVGGFREILDGKCDDMPEQAFMMVGTIEEAREKAERLAKED